MKPERDYDETKTHSHVEKWNSIILVLALVCLMGWSTTQIDYVLAFPQAPVESDVYMRIPKGMDLVIYNEDNIIVQGKPNNYVLQLHRNVYVSKVSRRV